MELIYLWVEEYKNIHNTGFHFSNKYKCNFDENTSTLTIEENKDHFSLLPEWINITAIVGRNGSGKSSLLEVLKEASMVTLTQQLSSKFILLYKESVEENLLCNTNIEDLNFCINKTIGVKEDRTIKPFVFIKECNKLESPYFHHTISFERIVLSYSHNCGKRIFENLNSFFGFDELVFIFKILDSTKYNNISGIDKEVLNSLLNYLKELREIYKKEEDSKKKLEILIIHNLVVYVLDIVRYVLNSIIDSPEEAKKEIQNSLNRLNQIIKKIIEKEVEIDEGFEEVIKWWEKEFIPSINERVKKTIRETKIYFGRIREEEKDFITRLKKFIQELKELEEKEIVFSKKGQNKEEIEDIKIHILLKEITDDIVELAGGLKNIPLSGRTNFIDWIEVDLIAKNASYSNLSSGEKAILEYIANIFYFSVFIKEEGHPPIELFFLDEPDNFLHPEWKRQLIDITIKVVEGIRKECKGMEKFSPHFVITTHSPFIISDLSKDNIIFLDKDSDGKCKVVEGVDKEETFGANFYSLLKDSFFMEETMGEFARKKINEVIKFLNEEEDSEIKDNEEVQKVINKIGEPVIKRELQKMFFLKRKIEKEVEEKIEEAVRKILEERDKRK